MDGRARRGGVRRADSPRRSGQSHRGDGGDPLRSALGPGQGRRGAERGPGRGRQDRGEAADRSAPAQADVRIYTLSLHDALPIVLALHRRVHRARGDRGGGQGPRGRARLARGQQARLVRAEPCLGLPDLRGLSERGLQAGRGQGLRALRPEGFRELRGAEEIVARGAGPCAAAGFLAVLVSSLPGTAWSHGAGDRYDLPAPLIYFVAGAALTVGLSFVVMAVAARAPMRATPSGGFVVPLGPVLRWLRPACRPPSVVLVGLVLSAGLFGDPHPAKNLAPTFVWIAWWVGLSLVVACLGNVCRPSIRGAPSSTPWTRWRAGRLGAGASPAAGPIRARSACGRRPSCCSASRGSRSSLRRRRCRPGLPVSASPGRS